MIILLNGTSSSGKTSIARELLRVLPEPYFFFSIDQFLEPSMPQKINMELEKDLKIIDRAISGFNKALQTYAEAIDNIVIPLFQER
jgi:chloramphenicol 3-O phosphotransferase